MSYPDNMSSTPYVSSYLFQLRLYIYIFGDKQRFFIYVYDFLQFSSHQLSERGSHTSVFQSQYSIPLYWLKFKPVIFYSVVSSILSHILRNTDLYSLLYIYVFHIFSIYVLSLYMYVQVLIQLVNESPPQKEDVKA